MNDTGRADFLQLAAEYRAVPVMRTRFADSETPMGLYRKLAGQVGSFLLESADQAGKWSRYSFIGVNTHGVLTERDGQSVWMDHGLAEEKAFGGPLPQDPLDALDTLVSRYSGPHLEGAPPFLGGVVGYIGWDAVRVLENLPNPPRADHPVPWLHMALVSDLVVFDHHTSEVILIAIVHLDGAASQRDYDDAVARLDALHRRLLEPTSSLLSIRQEPSTHAGEPQMPREDFLAMVEVAKKHIRDGDVFQVVLSQRLEAPVNAGALEVYRVLRSLNPSPYMYLLECSGVDGVAYQVVGSSPEALVTVKNSRAYSHPIAGSRPRGLSPEADIRLADDLRADSKEQAEHLMLVDLARNDLSKVCTAGSVEVTEFMEVERFSHIMHLVSSVEGDLRPDASPVDVFRATFPAGTLSGAPKPRALEIIDALEPSRRGVYGGVVGYFSHTGDMDLAIAIRTVWMRQGRATVQAGAGIVADSVPQSEYEETLHKSAAPLRAVLQANALVPDDFSG